jgi:hypothetical protein
MGIAALAGGASIASTALSMTSSILKGYGSAAADKMRADQAQRAAEFGRVQADLTDTHYREELNTTLGNIDAIRAAAKTDPNSPTTQAIEDRQSMLSDRQRTAAVVTLRSQADEDEASARYLRQAGRFSIGLGYLDAASKLAKGISGGLGGGLGGGGGE